MVLGRFLVSRLLQMWKIRYSRNKSELARKIRSSWLFWWGRWDLNPGSPTPQAGILNQSSHIQNQSSQRFCDSDMEAIRRPQTSTKYADEIIKTLLDLKKEGKAKNTIETVATSLKKLVANTDLRDPENVKLYIANLKLRNNTKQKLVFSY